MCTVTICHTWNGIDDLDLLAERICAALAALHLAYR